jgi:hypothetical protein
MTNQERTAAIARTINNIRTRQVITDRVIRYECAKAHMKVSLVKIIAIGSGSRIMPKRGTNED